MKSIENAHPYWVHASPTTKKARLHLAECRYCNRGIGLASRPAVPGGPKVWRSYATIAEARSFMEMLPYPDKSDCVACVPKALVVAI